VRGRGGEKGTRRRRPDFQKGEEKPPRGPLVGGPGRRPLQKEVVPKKGVVGGRDLKKAQIPKEKEELEKRTFL